VSEADDPQQQGSKLVSLERIAEKALVAPFVSEDKASIEANAELYELTRQSRTAPQVGNEYAWVHR
jgi:hypothetical protein